MQRCDGKPSLKWKGRQELSKPKIDLVLDPVSYTVVLYVFVLIMR